MVELSIINNEGESGTLKLSPYLNVFSHESTIRLPEGTTVKDIRCPYCGESLITQEKCPVCGSDVANILVTSSTKLVDFKFCSKAGCKWHGISEEDEKSIILDDSDEW